jgi:CDP-diacylglycerol--serine O-phosphatidyltransferase
MKRPKVFAVVPTLLTLGNAACGFGAITIAAKVGPQNVGGNELFVASLLIFLAMLFDALDGSAARWANQESEFGAILDSLCDALSFGAAPAFLMLQFAHPQNHQIESSIVPFFVYHPRLLWVIAVLFVVCAILRLARFTVETDDEDSHDFFSGLPSPAAAGAVCAFPIAMQGLQELLEPVSVADATGVVAQTISGGHTAAEWLIPGIAMLFPLITLALASLMVSNFRYPHVFNQLFKGKRNRLQVVQLVFTVALVFLVQEMALPVIFLYFAFAAPLKWVWTEFLGGRLYKAPQT